MRFLVYLVTFLLFSTAVAQNPTVLQGNYITNVFGMANFIRNPNAYMVGANATTNPYVSTSSATVTRSTATPLMGTAEFTITTSATNGYAEWTTRAFDQGMKYQVCEARFMYRGFSTGSTTAQVISGTSTVIASQVLNPATDPQTVSILFNCGDLSQTTKLRFQQATANLTGTNEIGAIYMGLATNLSNVAQAQVIFKANDTNGASIPNASTTGVIFPITTFDTDGGYNASTGFYTIRRAGRYLVHARVAFGYVNPFPAGIDNYLLLNRNGNSFATSFWSMPSYAAYPNPQITTVVDLNVGDQINVAVQQTTGGARNLLGSNQLWSEFSLTRFPSASEQVLTPNITSSWGGVTYSRTADSIAVGLGAAAPTGYTVYSDSAWNTGKVTYGKCQATDVDANRIGCKIPSLPVGAYKMTVTGLLYETSVNGGTIICSYALYESTTNNFFASTTNNYNTTAGGVVYEGRTITGIFNNTSVADRNFLIAANKTYDTTSGSVGNCQAFVSNAGGDIGNFTIMIQPLDYQLPLPVFIDQTPYTVTATSLTVPVAPYARYEASGAGTTITLFGCTAATKGYNVEVKRVDASNNITVARSGSDTIDGATSDLLAVNFQATQYVCNGSGGWRRF